MEPEDKDSAYQRWYKNHKQELAKKRRERYANDPVYRQKVLEQRHRQTERARAGRAALPPEYTFTLKAMAEALGVTIWTIREWRKKEYFPEPLRCGRNLYFTENQGKLLNDLKKFLNSKGTRISRADKSELADKVAFIHSNW